MATLCYYYDDDDDDNDDYDNDGRNLEECKNRWTLLATPTMCTTLITLTIQYRMNRQVATILTILHMPYDTSHMSGHGATPVSLF